MSSDPDEMRGLRAKSAASLWRPLADFVQVDARMGAWAQQKSPVRRFVCEFIRFGVKQAWACLFGGLIIATRLYCPAHAPLDCPAHAPLAR